MFLNVLAAALTMVLRVFSLYFFIIALFCLKRRTSYKRMPPRTRFACLIAARNEEQVIGKLVESLRRQDYPDDLYDIYVIPNNCTDHTEQYARQAGACILHCLNPVACKGDALHEAVSCLLSQDYDVFCVFDADNVVERQFLARMNDAFCSGVRVAKAALRVKNPADSSAGFFMHLYSFLISLFALPFLEVNIRCVH